MPPLLKTLKLVTHRLSSTLIKVVLLTLLILFIVLGTGGLLIDWNKYKVDIIREMTLVMGCNDINMENITGSLLTAKVKIGFSTVNYADKFNSVYLSMSAVNTSVGISRLSLALGRGLKITAVDIDNIFINTNTYTSIYDVFSIIGHKYNAANVMPSVNILNGQVSLPNDEFLQNISAIIDFSNGVTANLKVVSHSKEYLLSINRPSGGHIEFTCKGPEWVIRYTGEINDGLVRGALNVSGVNSIMFFSPLLLYLSHIDIGTYSLYDNFNASGELVYGNGGYSLSNLTFDSEVIKSTVNIAQDGANYKVSFNVSELDLDRILSTRVDNEDTRTMSKTGILEGLISSSDLDGTLSMVRIDVGIDVVRIKNQQIGGIHIDGVGTWREIKLKELRVKQLPGGGELLYECNRVDNDSAALGCRTIVNGGNSGQLLALFGVNLGPESRAILDGVDGNQLAISGLFRVAPQLISISGGTLTVGDINVLIDISIKFLKNRTIVHGQIRVDNLPDQLISESWSGLLTRFAVTSRGDVVISLNTMPFDFWVNVDLGIVSRNIGRGRASLDVSYNGGAIIARNVKIRFKDKMMMGGDMQISAPGLRPYVSGSIDAALITLGSDASGTVDMDAIVDELWGLRPLASIFDGNIGVKIKRIAYRNNNFNNFTSEFLMDSGTVTIKNMRTQGLEGDISVKGNILATASAQVTLVLGLKSVNCGTLSSMFLGYDNVRGYCSANGVFFVNNRKDAPWKASISGNMQWAVVDLRAKGMDLKLVSEHLVKVRNESELVSLLDMTRVSPRSYQVGNITGSTKVQNGLAVSSFSMQGHVASGTGVIQILLPNLLMNGLLRFNMIPVGSSFPVVIEVGVKGSTIDADIIYNLQKLKSQVVR